MKYVIIGGSVAACACAARLKQLDPVSDVTMISAEERPYAKMALPYLLSGEMTEDVLWMDRPGDIDFRAGTRVTAVSPGGKVVETDNGPPVAYDKLLIAAGAHAVLPDFEGSTLPAVACLRNLSDVADIQGQLAGFSDGAVLLSGAGLVSIEAGDALWKRGFSPTFLISSRKVLSMILDDEGSALLESIMREKGVAIHFGETIASAASGPDGITVTTQSGAEYNGRSLIVGKGTHPNIDFLSQSGIATDWGVLVNEFLETNTADIFAAGDVCQGDDIVWGDKRVNALWPAAVEQGRHTAYNMTRAPRPYRGSIARNIVTAFGVTVFTAGLSNCDERGKDIVKRSTDNSYVKIVLENNVLKGAVFINVAVDPGVYVAAIEEQRDVTGLENVMVSGALSPAHFRPFLRNG